RPARQHDAIDELPAADVRPAPVLRRPALIGIDRERSLASACEALPDRRWRWEPRHVARALRRGVPLKRIEQPVVAELDAAVERVERARGEVVCGRLELHAPAAL